MASTTKFTQTTKDAFLSLEFAAPFVKGGQLWQNAMQYFAYTMLNPKGMDKKQAEANRALREKVLAAYDPWKCRYFLSSKGLTANNAVLRLDHDKVLNKVLRQANYAKFTQNPVLLIRLMSETYPKIVYDNKHDDVLGIGSGDGDNKLGRDLMALREKLEGQYDQEDPATAFSLCANVFNEQQESEQ